MIIYFIKSFIIVQDIPFEKDNKSIQLIRNHLKRIRLAIIESEDVKKRDEILVEE